MDEGGKWVSLLNPPPSSQHAETFGRDSGKCCKLSKVSVEVEWDYFFGGGVSELVHSA